MSTPSTVANIASAGLLPALNWVRNGFSPLSLAQLRAVYPTLPAEEAGRYLRPLNAAMRWADIVTPRRMAAFLAQVGAESNALRDWVEGGTGQEYEGRARLGNTQPGDGVLYKGRGPIQLTGRANYAAAGSALGIPLEARPELAAQPREGCMVAAWYWASHALNPLADLGTLEAFRAITQAVNGGQNGAELRERYWHTALAVLGGQ